MIGVKFQQDLTLSPKLNVVFWYLNDPTRLELMLMVILTWPRWPQVLCMLKPYKNSTLLNQKAILTVAACVIMCCTGDVGPLEACSTDSPWRPGIILWQDQNLNLHWEKSYKHDLLETAVANAF